VRVISAQALELEYLELFLFGRSAQGIGLGTRLLGRAEHPRNLIAAGEKTLEHRLAKVLLADNGNFHGYLLQQGFNEDSYPSQADVMSKLKYC
jgi:hypothetical protein